MSSSPPSMKRRRSARPPVASHPCRPGQAPQFALLQLTFFSFGKRAGQLIRYTSERVHQRISSLAPRERRGLDKVIAGRINKIMASQLDMSSKTVKARRAGLMAKMRAH